ncbi:hypothetical protein FHG87_025148 [Trinorchestia longiramus]|nr:hypothetical protein FHG87_025148 [Trinorchestia longiramus]
MPSRVVLSRYFWSYKIFLPFGLKKLQAAPPRLELQYGYNNSCVALETVEHLVLECSKYEHERESLIDVVHEQCGENKWNARCVEEDSGMRYLVGLDEECNMTVVDTMKDLLVHAWNKQQ